LTCGCEKKDKEVPQPLRKRKWSLEQNPLGGVGAKKTDEQRCKGKKTRKKITTSGKKRQQNKNTEGGGDGEKKRKKKKKMGRWGGPRTLKIPTNKKQGTSLCTWNNWVTMEKKIFGHNGGKIPGGAAKNQKVKTARNGRLSAGGTQGKNENVGGGATRKKKGSTNCVNPTVQKKTVGAGQQCGGNQQQQKVKEKGQQNKNRKKGTKTQEWQQPKKKNKTPQGTTPVG